MANNLLTDDMSRDLADDGLTRDGEAEESATGARTRALGFLLDEEDEGKVAKAVVKFRTDQNDARSRNRATWKRNAWWREGRRGIRLDKKQDHSQWEVKMPLGMSAAPPVPNKTDRLCRRVANAILVDKPYPECEPGDDSNEARDAAEFATRYLSVKSAPAELNMNRILRSALDKSQTYASAFAWYTMDPHGGGHRPRTMLAHPAAQTADDALIDPTTGLGAAEDELQERFVGPDGALVDYPEDADLQWLPSPKVRILTGLQLDFLPASARGIADAIGVVITDATTLGDLRALFPDRFDRMTKDQLAAVCTWRPENMEDILPPYTKDPEDQKEENGDFKDSQLVVVTTVYYESCAEYPFGAYVVVGGNEIVLHRQKWSAVMEGADGVESEEPLTIPVAQARCLDDDLYDNPYGIAIAEHLGPADEIRNVALGFEIEHMFRAANPIPMIPIGSIVQPKQFINRTGDPVFVSPNGKPEWEQVPPLSPTVPALRAEMTIEMDDESGLQQAGQGVASASVQSGTHAQTIVQEALKAISNIKDNIGDFYISSCQIILQLTRAYCTVPQLLSYVGDDGAYKEKEWSRVDFRTTKRVSIARGSFTMHTLLAKQEMAGQALANKVIDADDYMELIAGGISPVLGMDDNPHLLRIRTQLDAYMEGPSEEWLAAYAETASAFQQAQAQAAQDPSAQQPGAPAPTMQPPEHPFSARLPVDLEPMPAKIRHRQLARKMASGKFRTFPPMWQQLLLAEYAEMKNAAGVMTVPETQAAQQQAQQATSGAAQQQAQALQAMEQQRLQLEGQKLQAEAQKIAHDMQLQQAKIQQEAAHEAARLQLEQAQATAQAQLDQQKLAITAEAERAKQQLAAAAAERAAEVERMRADVEAQKVARQQAIEQQKLDLARAELEQKRLDDEAQRQIELTFRTDELALRRQQMEHEEERSLREFQLKATEGTTAKPTITAPEAPPLDMVTEHERDPAGRILRSVSRPASGEGEAVETIHERDTSGTLLRSVSRPLATPDSPESPSPSDEA